MKIKTLAVTCTYLAVFMAGVMGGKEHEDAHIEHALFTYAISAVFLFALSWVVSKLENANCG